MASRLKNDSFDVDNIPEKLTHINSLLTLPILLQSDFLTKYRMSKDRHSMFPTHKQAEAN